MLSDNLCPVQEFIQRWGVLEDSPVELVGDPGDGTTIDLDEPFLLRWNHFHVYVIKDSRIGCDDDGWFVKTNKEPSYPHFFHLFTHTEIRSVLFKGDLDIRYIGFGDQSKRDVAFNQSFTSTRSSAGSLCRFQPDLCLPRGGGL